MTDHDLKDRVSAAIVGNAGALISLSHDIHSEPEIAFEEHRSVQKVAGILRAAGFDTAVGVYGLDTAMEATFGDGDLTVAICAEYDALPAIGHSCGHNMISASAAGAAIALASVATEVGLRIKVLGTPAEEHGGGKVLMLAEGAWEDAAFSLMVHPDTGHEVGAGVYSSTAADRFEVKYVGRSAHAAAAAQQGINAGAAATIALTAIGLLRQQLSPTTNVNAFVSHGGDATNVIPGETSLLVEVRAQDVEEWRRVKKQVLSCFEAGAVGTACTWSYAATEPAYAPVRNNPILADLWDANLEAVGRTPDKTPRPIGGSSDMGNVSQVVPAIHPMIAVLGSQAVPHHPDFGATALSPAADQAIIDGAQVLAWTVLDVATRPEIREAILELQKERRPGSTRRSVFG